jgi:hypothetical protein
MERPAPRAGVIMRLLGVVFIFVGVLDSLLSWRGGFAVSGLYVLLIGTGAYLYLIGAIRRSNGS